MGWPVVAIKQAAARGGKSELGQDMPGRPLQRGAQKGARLDLCRAQRLVVLGQSARHLKMFGKGLWEE